MVWMGVVSVQGNEWSISMDSKIEKLHLFKVFKTWRITHFQGISARKDLPRIVLRSVFILQTLSAGRFTLQRATVES